ncbi:transcriptional regulator [Macrococcoides goetzii]|uniref:transcriptional regulator n=1 Tax=Staphylococcaceae TaxID=90964 RepID=UPI00165D44B1|nr:MULTISPECIES: transcriptional regulator [Macrococcus]MBC9873684.1 transcriptional regulator [Macrococcus bohemicus]MCH4983968.1 transcriptional regulator [Macrococcus sp. PK]
MTINTINKSRVALLEHYWINYQDLKKQREYRKYELLYVEEDNNVGGGKSNIPGRPTESQVIKLMNDARYSNLDSMITAIEHIYNTCDEYEKFIIENRYWNNNIELYEWEDIAHALTKLRSGDNIISRYAVLRKRNQILDKFADMIGWID